MPRLVSFCGLEDEVPCEPSESYDAINGLNYAAKAKYWVVLEPFQQLDSSHVRGENVYSGRTAPLNAER